MRTHAIPLFQYWDDPAVPPDIRPLVDSFAQGACPAFQHRLFHRAQAAEHIGQHLGEAKQAAFLACAVPAMQADYFRLCALSVAGGCYADADYQLHRPLAELPGLMPSAADRPLRALISTTVRGAVSNGLLYFEQGTDPLLRLALDMATWSIGERLEVGTWLVTGPGSFDVLHQVLKLGSLDPQRNWPELYPQEGDTTELAHSRRWVQRFCEQIGSLEQAAAWMQGVQLLPYPLLCSFVTEPDLAYKTTERHWLNWKASLYR